MDTWPKKAEANSMQHKKRTFAHDAALISMNTTPYMSS